MKLSLFRALRIAAPVALLAGMLCLFSGCESGSPGGSATPPTTQGATPGQSGGDAGSKGLEVDRLRVGSGITIYFSDVPSGMPPSIETRIRQDGTITLPLGVTVTAAGKLTGDLEQEIQKAYVPKYYVRMTVSVKAEERVFFVGGYVKAPGRFAYTSEMTVLKAIKVGGDFSEFGNKKKVELIRADKSKFIIDCKKAQKDPKLDLEVLPGDTIYVPQRW